jgi:predicted ATP-grasp superfamily ATP-dependent carboligase
LLCGLAGVTAFPPCWQRLSQDGRFTYHGGSLVRERELAQRATSLAIQAINAMPPARGYVGVDMVLSDAADGLADVVIEINPRITTSYVGLRAAISQNLAGLMLACVRGERPELHVCDWSIDFTSDGLVRSLA